MELVASRKFEVAYKRHLPSEVLLILCKLGIEVSWSRIASSLALLLQDEDLWVMSSLLEQRVGRRRSTADIKKSRYIHHTTALRLHNLPTLLVLCHGSCKPKHNRGIEFILADAMMLDGF
jgi:hypothetical protein